MKQDLSYAQFVAQLERQGFSQPEGNGKVDLGIPGHRATANINHGGSTRREQIAYLQRERARYERRMRRRKLVGA